MGKIKTISIYRRNKKKDDEVLMARFGITVMIVCIILVGIIV